MSATIASKSLVPSGWKTIAAVPADFIPSSVSAFTTAVLIANRRSSVGWRSVFLPRRMSRNPTYRRLDARLQLRLEALQCLDALLQRRVRGEESRDRLAGARR